MKDGLRKSLRFVFVVMFIFALSQVIHLMLDNWDSDQANSHAQSIAGANATTTVEPTTEPVPSTTEAVPTETTVPETVPPETTEATLPPDEHTEYLRQLNIHALQRVNSEVIGWIYIPDTNVNHPLLHTKDNSTYLHTTWEGKENSAGSIFMETKCSPSLTDFNTIIYGHNMRNGSMFGKLKQYRDYDHYLEHRYVYIVTGYAIYRYEVFSAYEAGINTDTYRLQFTGHAKRKALQHYIDSSVWEAELTPTLDDRILTLSTCTGTGKYETRWVVQAVLDGIWDK